MFRRIRALVFDFDGTLVDASDAIWQSFNSALTRYGAPAMTDIEIKRMIGRPLRDMFSSVLPNASRTDVEQLITFYREAFLPISVDLSRPLPGLRQLLDHCRPDYKLAIATSRISSGAIRILKSMHLRDRFDAIIGLEHVTNPKPHPEPVLRALAILGITPREAIMIGDIPDDMRAGKSAGAAAVGVVSDLYPADTLRAAGADATITELDQLIALLEK